MSIREILSNTTAYLSSTATTLSSEVSAKSAQLTWLATLKLERSADWILNQNLPFLTNPLVAKAVIILGTVLTLSAIIALAILGIKKCIQLSNDRLFNMKTQAFENYLKQKISNYSSQLQTSQQRGYKAVLKQIIKSDKMQLANLKCIQQTFLQGDKDKARQLWNRASYLANLNKSHFAA